MNPRTASDMTKQTKLESRFTIITVMFLSVLLGMLIYTITTIHDEQSNARLIDIVGHQRMLLQKHINEVLLASQQVAADYPITRTLIHSTLDALIEGQAVAHDPVTNLLHKVPAVPTQAVLLKLQEQRQHFDTVTESADRLLSLTPNHADFRRQLQTLRAQNSATISIADDAVKLLNVHSESKIATMVKWESSIALLVALLGIFVTAQGIRAGKNLEKEIAERKRVETALRKSEIFLHSVIENIPDMVFVKEAEHLRYIQFNKASETQTGYARNEFIGKNDQDIFSKEVADFFTQKDREAISRRQLVTIPDEVIHTKSQGMRHLHTKKIPVCDQHGTPEYVLGISEDITERLQAEETLRQSEERYRTLYDDNPSMYFTVDIQGIVLSVNAFGAEQLAYAVEELEGHSFIDLFVEEDRPPLQQRLETCFATPEFVFSWEFRKERKDRSIVWVKEVARVVSSKGRMVALIVSEDISDRRETERALQEWKDLTDSILGQLPKGFAYRCLNKKTWPVVYSSDGFEDLTGYPTSALLSGEVTYDTLMAPGENERVWPIVQEALAQHTPYENEHQIITKDGTKKWILARGRFIFDKTGQLLYLDGLNVDITEHKRIQNELRASEARFRSLVEHVPFCIHEIEIDGKISSMNQAGQKMLEVESEAKVIGCSYLHSADENNHKLISAYFTKAVQGEPINFVYRVTTHGKEKVFSKSFIPLRDNNKNVVKIIGISDDITERTFSEERLRESEAKRIEALKQSDALKSALLSSVSHELRTPLTAMKTSVSTILGNTPNGMTSLQQEFLTGVDKEINYMSRLVDNLLDMSQIEAGTLIPHQEWHLLEDLIEGAIRRTESTLEVRNIKVSIPDNLPPVFVDAVEIQQVLINLLDNAIKYSTPNSSIQIEVCTEEHHIEVKVSNTGDPLLPQDVERIFERFYRRQILYTQPIRGTGLGLAICKGIIEAHGGRIWATSKGTEVTMTFTVPLTEAMVSFTLEGRHKVQGDV
ncbi:MAG: hypothetical protein NPIRA05_13180 [Nitrospirales bacterium]|nr:MAG: hypothetical protein NPIRA05_13180 [Nitrospirales bacterium]